MTSRPRKFRVEAFRPEHYISIAAGASWLTLEEAAASYMRGPAFTGFVDDEIAGCGGLVFLWSGVAEAWAFLTDLGRQHPLFAHRTCSRFMNDIIRRTRPRRVQCDVEYGFGVGHRWATSLGFEPEVVRPLYGPRGEDVVHYSLFPQQEPAHA